jgi:hypothetical protein
MKLLPLVFVAALASCGSNSGNNNATSTPLDSTKISGTAPVQYGPDNPADDTAAVTGANEGVIQNNDGTMNRRTQSGVSDGPVSNQDGSPSPNANGTGQNVSNTTDARTTGGSAQGSGQRR